MKRSLLLCVLTSAGSLLWQAPASADDVQLLPPSLMVPSSKDTVPAGTFKKDPPWTIGMSWPGVGNWLVQGIGRRDYPAVQGGLLMSASVIIGVNLLVDVMYGVINPRIRHT